jgi:hypothetical protein
MKSILNAKIKNRLNFHKDKNLPVRNKIRKSPLDNFLAHHPILHTKINLHYKAKINFNFILLLTITF